MKFFRKLFILKSMALFTGALVLNMSLFLAEVEALKLLQDRAMTENIAKLLMGAANEEEKDFCGSCEEELSGFKSATLLHQNFLVDIGGSTTARKYHDIDKADKTISPFLETLSPPPKFTT